MPNEFIARNGITSLGNVIVSGSITATGAINMSGSIASASFAASASNALSAQTASYVLNAVSASYILNAQSASNAVSAATASSADNFLARGTITAQTIVVQTITSSVDFVTGSTRFGSIIGNTHQFTGSVSMTGSLAVVTNGTEFQVNATGVNLGNALTDSHIISGSLTVNPGGLFVSGSGNVGIGTTNPSGKFQAIQNQNGSSAFYFSNATSGTSARSRVIIESDASTGNLSLGMHSSTHASTPNEAWIWGSGASTPLILGTVGSEKVRITPGGTLLVNATTSSYGAALGYSFGVRGTNSQTLISIALANQTLDTQGAYIGLDGSVGYISMVDNKPWTFVTNNVERMRIAASGSVGIGVTPSAWGVSTPALQVASYGSISTTGGIDTQISNNAYYDGTNWRYIASQEAANYYMNRDTHVWRYKSAGTAGNTITWNEAMRITNAGNVVINSTVANYKFQVNSGINTSTATVMTLQQATNGAVKDAAGFGLAINNGGESTNAADLIISTASGGSLGERMRITSGGNIFINNPSGVSLNGLTNFLSVSSTTYNLFDISRFSDNAFGPNFYLVKSRNGTIGGNTIVANGDNLGNINWLGANGTGFTDAANIRAEVDGTPGTSNDMPGRIVFATTGDGSGTPTERMRITSGGEVVRGPIRELATSLSPPDPYTGDARLSITHTPWGGNNDSGTVYVEFQARTYGNNQTTCAYGIITYRLGDNGINVTNVSTAGVTVSNVTISTDVSTNYILRITFGVAQNADRISIFARTTNGVVSSISANIV